MRVVGFKTHSTDIPTQSDEEISGDENKHFRYLVNYKFPSYEDHILDEYAEDDGFVYTREHRETNIQALTLVLLGSILGRASNYSPVTSMVNNFLADLASYLLLIVLVFFPVVLFL